MKKSDIKVGLSGLYFGNDAEEVNEKGSVKKGFIVVEPQHEEMNSHSLCSVGFIYVWIML